MKRLKKLTKNHHKAIWKWVIFLTGAVALALISLVILFSLLVAFESVVPKVGIIPIKGEIYSDSSDSYLGYDPGARDVIDLIKEADADTQVSAIMLDINSGGGSVVASKELAHAVAEAEKPVVAYIGEVGASGAYLVAASADYVVCDGDSLTGSIGVVSVFPNYRGLMNITGVNMTVMASGDMKAAGNPYEEFTPQQEALYMALLLEAFESFKAQIQAYRPQLTGLEELSDGRVVSGRQALNYGLVDELGSRSLALRRAAEMGGIEGEPEEKMFVTYGSPLSSMFTSMGYNLASGLKRGLTESEMELRA